MIDNDLRVISGNFSPNQESCQQISAKLFTENNEKKDLTNKVVNGIVCLTRKVVKTAKICRKSAALPFLFPPENPYMMLFRGKASPLNNIKNQFPVESLPRGSAKHKFQGDTPLPQAVAGPHLSRLGSETPGRTCRRSAACRAPCSKKLPFHSKKNFRFTPNFA